MKKKKLVSKHTKRDLSLLINRERQNQTKKEDIGFRLEEGRDSIGKAEGRRELPARLPAGGATGINSGFSRKGDRVPSPCFHCRIIAFRIWNNAPQSARHGQVPVCE